MQSIGTSRVVRSVFSTCRPVRLAQRSAVVGAKRLGERNICNGINDQVGAGVSKVSQEVGKLGSSASAAVNLASAGAAKLGIPSVEKVDVTKLVSINFLAQVVLTGVGWAVVFFTTHTELAKGSSITPPTVALLIGLVLSAYSAWLSFGYIKRVKLGGEKTLQGFKVWQEIQDHLYVNFAGAVATIVALQAEVGLLLGSGAAHNAGKLLHLVKEGVIAEPNLAVVAAAQASANIITAHIVSIVLLTIIARQILTSYKKVIDFAEQLQG